MFIILKPRTVRNKHTNFKSKMYKLTRQIKYQSALFHVEKNNCYFDLRVHMSRISLTGV